VLDLVSLGQVGDRRRQPRLALLARRVLALVDPLAKGAAKVWRFRALPNFAGVLGLLIRGTA
jgi:hypothetical protein